MTYTTSLYDLDDVAWATEQAQLLRERRWDELDLQNLIEEIEDIGNRHRDALESHLETLLMHRLKQLCQTERSSRSWELSIQNAAREIRKLLRKRPSLRPHIELCFVEVYQDAREVAALETELPLVNFPERCSVHLRNDVLQMLEDSGSP